jgi:hypothetical protein
MWPDALHVIANIWLGFSSSADQGFRRNFVSRKFRKTGYETIFVFRKNEGRVSRVSQFRKTAEITKETSFAKHENRENIENLK